MIEVLQETKAVNYQLADSQECKAPVSSPMLIKHPKAMSDDICCQVTRYLLSVLEFHLPT